ncbi:esterase family protein [Olsenella sp. DSM 107455]|uniref:Esterase family protein n=1 Tax=Thermophilibacter gallinarum TaxID=2779357 RepID=A0ABR9QRK7_9ACTN|nr:alpha/beta hydrolase-fold protein [Thermophilibacter gallinarum]MBE5023584.1 esterase family protein [Thermophilibacter gallinarum]
MDKKNIVCTSSILGADMHVITYGKKGLPVVVFPTQGQEPESLEEVGVVDELADYIDSGVIQLFCTETVDDESWGGQGDPAERAARQESYYHYVVDELVPLVNKVSKSGARPLALGFDAGATQASIVALRRPDLFQGCVCLSGCYDARRYFGDWMDATLYENTPCAFLPNMTPEHPYVAVYNQRQLLFCTGQEASEADSLRSTRVMDEQLARLGVEAWCDYWGADVAHTWFWWKKQLRYFLPIVLADVEKTTAAEKPAKKRATTRKKAAAPKAAAAEKKPAAAKAATATKTTAKAAAPKKAATTAKAAAKPAAKKAATTTKATAAKVAAAPKKVAAKPAAEKTAKAATPAKAEKPAAPAKAVKATAPAKATKAATPAKAVKPAAPAKATKAAVPAKATKPATPAKATKPATKGKATK